MSDLIQYRIEGGSAAELVESIERGVAAGALAPGQRLPSVRRLATQIGLSPATVSSGLAELRRRGVVLSEPRRGTRIGERVPIASARTSLPVPSGARDLSRGNPDPTLLPDLQGPLAGLELPVRLYGEPAAVPELLALARERLSAEGLPCERLCIVSGALDGIERVLESELRPGDRVAVENPGYAALFDLLRAQGLVLEPVAVDERGMRPHALRAALARGAQAAIITPRGQNPTGAALDTARAGELRRALGERPGTLVIEDDHLGPVAGSELHSTVIGAVRWAAVRSVAKALGPDLRLAILAGDPQTVERVQGRQECGPGWVSHLLQRLVLALWADPAVDAQVDRAREAYARRRCRLLACLDRHGVGASGVSGLNVWVAVDDETGTVGALAQRGWMVAPGAPFCLPGSGSRGDSGGGARGGAIRVTIATLAEAEAERLALELCEVLAARPARTG